MMHESATSTRGLRELCRVLFRFRRRALALFFLTMLLVTLGLVVAPRKYESVAKLFVRVGRESVALDPTATTGGNVIEVFSQRENEINSVVEVLGSRTVLEKTVEQVGAAHVLSLPDGAQTSERQREKAIEELEESLGVSAQKGSDVITLWLEADSPERARKILTALVDVYLGEHLRIHRTQGSHEFFLAQTELAREQLERAATELRDAKNQYGIVTIAGRRDSLQDQITTVESDLLTTRAALRSAQAKLTASRLLLADLPPSVVSQFIDGLPNEAGANFQTLLRQLQVREQEILSTVTPSHPSALAIRQQVQQVERILANAELHGAGATDAAVLTEQVDIDALSARLTALETQRAELLGQLGQLNEQEVHVAELERRVTLLEETYLRYSRSLEQTRVDQELKRERISNVNILQAPSLVRDPTSPVIWLTLLLAAVAGAIGALALALLSDQFDTSLKTPEEAERVLQLPVVMNIPQREQQRVFCV